MDQYVLLLSLSTGVRRRFEVSINFFLLFTLDSRRLLLLIGDFQGIPGSSRGSFISHRATLHLGTTSLRIGWNVLQCLQLNRRTLSFLPALSMGPDCGTFHAVLCSVLLICACALLLDFK